MQTAAIILAGSHVWQNDAFESLCPRPMLPVVNRPLIAHGLRWLATQGITDVVVCTNSGARTLRQRLDNEALDSSNVHFYEDRVPRGPAGCVRDAAEIVPADRWVIADATILPGANLANLLAAHEEQRADVTVVVNQTQGDAERLAVDASPAGVYVFSQVAMEMIALTGYQDIKEQLIPQVARRGGAARVYPAEQPSPRVSGLDSYILTQEWALERVLMGDIALEGYERRGGACVHARASVSPEARLVGPVLIGPDTRIGARAIVVGPTIVGARCEIGAEAVVATSVLWDRARIGAKARLKQCLVAAQADVAANATLHRMITQSQGSPHAARRVDEPLVAAG